MKKMVALLLFGALGLALPMPVRAQDNDAARIAMQKRNAKRSRKDVKAGKRALRKSQRSMGAPKKHAGTQPQTTSTLTAAPE